MASHDLRLDLDAALREAAFYREENDKLKTEMSKLLAEVLHNHTNNDSNDNTEKNTDNNTDNIRCSSTARARARTKARTIRRRSLKIIITRRRREEILIIMIIRISINIQIYQAQGDMYSKIAKDKGKSCTTTVP